MRHSQALLTAILAVHLGCPEALRARPGDAQLYDLASADGWAVVDLGGKPVGDCRLAARDGVLIFDYPRHAPRLLVHAPAPLAGLQAVDLRVRSARAMSLVVATEDTDGARFVALATVEAGTWQVVRLVARDFRLADDSPVRKAELDPLVLGNAYVLLDLLSVRGGEGRNTLEIDSVEISRAAAPVDARALVVDGVQAFATEHEHDGDIVVRKGGTLRITAPRFVLDGDLRVEGGRVEVEKARLVIPSRYLHERRIGLSRGGHLSLAGSRLELTHGIELDVVERSSAQLRDTQVSGAVISSTLEGGGRVTLDNVTGAGEFIVNPGATFAAKDSRGFLLWLVLGPGFRGRLHFPDGRRVDQWSAMPLQDATVTRSADVMWGVVTVPGAGGTIVGSKLRAVATILTGDTEAEVVDVHNGELPPGGTLDTGDRRLTFEDAEVEAWNFYVTGRASLTLRRSTVGEAWGLAGSGTLNLIDSTCDGKGGNIKARGRTKLLLENARVHTSVVADEDAEIVIRRSILTGDLFAVGRSVVRLVASEIRGTAHADPPAVIRREALAAP